MMQEIESAVSARRSGFVFTTLYVAKDKHGSFVPCVVIFGTLWEGIRAHYRMRAVMIFNLWGP